jgi:hypothetical protein
MKTLTTLIKIHQNKIDQIVIDVKKLEEERLLCVAEIQRLEQEFQSELEKFGKSFEFAFVFEKYKEHIAKLKTNISSKILLIEKKVIDLRANLRVEFNSLKKFEHLLANRIKEEKTHREKREEAEISDNIIMKYNYK